MHTQLARRGHIHRAAAGDSRVNARDVGLGLVASRADANDTALGRLAAGMGDVDVVAAARQVVTRLIPEGEVTLAARRSVQRLIPQCIVVGTVRITP